MCLYSQGFLCAPEVQSDGWVRTGWGTETTTTSLKNWVTTRSYRLIHQRGYDRQTWVNVLTEVSFGYVKRLESYVRYIKVGIVLVHINMHILVCVCVIYMYMYGNSVPCFRAEDLNLVNVSVEQNRTDGWVHHSRTSRHFKREEILPQLLWIKYSRVFQLIPLYAFREFHDTHSWVVYTHLSWL